MTTNYPKRFCEMKEFSSNDSAPEIEAAVKGKEVDSVSIDWEQMNPILVFHFKDGDALHIEYDWIYEWGMESRQG